MGGHSWLSPSSSAVSTVCGKSPIDSLLDHSDSCLGRCSVNCSWGNKKGPCDLASFARKESYQYIYKKKKGGPDHTVELLDPARSEGSHAWTFLCDSEFFCLNRQVCVVFLSFVTTRLGCYKTQASCRCCTTYSYVCCPFKN